MGSQTAGTSEQQPATESPRESDAPKGVVKPSGRIEKNRFLSEVIIELGFADREAVERALEEERRKGRRMGRHLVDCEALTEQQLGMAIAERYGLDYLDLNVFEFDMAAANLITAAAARRYETVPVGFVDPDTLLMAIADPTDGFALNDISVMTRLEVKPAVAARCDILALIDRLPEPEEKHERPSPVIRRSDEEPQLEKKSPAKKAAKPADLSTEKSELLKELRDAIAAEGQDLEAERERWEIERAKLEAKLVDLSQENEMLKAQLGERAKGA